MTLRERNGEDKNRLTNRIFGSWLQIWKEGMYLRAYN